MAYSDLREQENRLPAEKRTVRTEPTPNTIPAGTSPFIAESIRRSQMEDRQAKALERVAADMGMTITTLKRMARTKPKTAIVDDNETRTPAWHLSRTPEWKEAHKEGMRQPQTEEEAEAKRERQYAKRLEVGYRVSARRRARLKDVTIEPVSRPKIIERDQRTCYLCGRIELADNEIHLDHVIPLSRGGAHSETNIKVTCAPCNISKGALTAAEYLARFGALRAAPAA